MFTFRSDATFDSRTCYWKYNIDQGARPCYPPSVKPVSHCCWEGHTCLGDTLCLSNAGPLYLGHCTARDWWNDTTVPEGCPKYFKDCEGKPGDDITITICNIKEDQTWEACCGAGQGAANCCDNGKFTIGNVTHEYAVQRPWNAKESLSYSLSSEIPSSATASPSNKTCAASTSGGPLHSMGAQIGVTAGLAVPLFVSMGLLFLERRKRRNLEAKLSGNTDPGSSEKEQENPTQSQLCRYEVDADPPGVELSSQIPVQELPYQNS
ncbi:hypothetical protein SVAN01_03510 [Stagonosporopsis vannaccii]|nr:hypothetical protein SVAN01_03510 [Stagonosporopsis vannaccii]